MQILHKLTFLFILLYLSCSTSWFTFFFLFVVHIFDTSSLGTLLSVLVETTGLNSMGVQAIQMSLVGPTHSSGVESFHACYLTDLQHILGRPIDEQISISTSCKANGSPQEGKTPLSLKEPSQIP